MSRDMVVSHVYLHYQYLRVSYGAPFVHLLFNTKKLDYFNDL